MTDNYWGTQQDYISFLSGACAILLTVVCFSLRKNNRLNLPWIWLGLFGLLKGLHSWLNLPRSVIAENTALTYTSLAIAILSYSCLIEFGRIGVKNLTGKSPGYWVHILVLDIALLGGFAGESGFTAASRYSMALIGGLWTAVAIAHASETLEQGREQRRIFIISMIFTLYALSTGLIVPWAKFYPACAVNETAFFNTFTFPIHLLRTTLLLTITMLLWNIQRSSLDEQLGKRTPFLAKPGVVITSYLIVFIGGWILTYRTGESIRNEMKSELLSTCRFAASTINPEDLKGNETQTDPDEPNYDRLRRTLEAIQSTKPEFRTLYLKVHKGDKILLDSPAGGEETEEEYEESQKTLLGATGKTEPTLIEDYTDKEGRWTSAFLPIRDQATGDVLAVLGINVSRAKYTRMAALMRLNAIAVAMLAFLLITLFLIAYHRQHGALLAVMAAERKAREIKERLSVTLQSIGDGVIAVDNKARITLMNDEAGKLTGNEPEKAAGKDVDKVFKIKGSRLDPIGKALTTGETLSSKEHLILASRKGELTPISLSCAPILDAEQITGAVLVFRDVTEQEEYQKKLLCDNAARRQAEKEAIETLSLLNATLESTDDGIVVVDNNRHVTIYNKLFLEMWGMEDALPTEDADELFELMSQQIADSEEFMIKEKDLRADPEKSTLDEIRLADGRIFSRFTCPQTINSEVVGHVWSFREVTESKRAEQAMMLHVAAINAADDCIIMLDNHGDIVFVNEAFEKETKYIAVELLGKSPRVLCAKTENSTYEEMQERIQKGQTWQGELVCSRKNGETHIADTTITPIFDESGGITHYVMIGRNVTERKAYEEQLDYQAHHDSLTGLPNRLHFMKELSRRVTSKNSGRVCLSVLFIDLDKFKLINDSLGHHIGDKLLVEVSSKLKSCHRKGDMLARVGGDEFTLIVDRTTAKSAAREVAQRILDALSEPIEIEGHQFYVGASIGISNCPEDGSDAEILLKNADTAMYKAKDTGRNNYQWYTRELGIATASRVNIERELRQAIEKGNLSIYYQPIVKVETMEITGAEALLRWNHKAKGFIPPSMFIPVAEETGLIIPIGRYVLQTACWQAKKWIDAGYPAMEMNVNVSPAQLEQDNFAEEVLESLKRTGFTPEYLNLEIIETIFASSQTKEVRSLQHLREHGVLTSIDDFGMGYSSLGRLKQFPIAHIKVDGSFIKNIVHDPEDRAVTKSIINMAHNLGIKVTAEWVESQAQLDTVASLGCDYIQGYLISPAITAENFEDLLRIQTQKAA